MFNKNGYTEKLIDNRVPLLTRKKVQPTFNSDVRDDLLYCNYLLFFDNFSNLRHENK